jgi:hypothetical protein
MHFVLDILDLARMMKTSALLLDLSKHGDAVLKKVL